MQRKIILNGTNIESITVMRKEIFNKLQIPNSQNLDIDFSNQLSNYLSQYKIEKLEIIWKDFSISLLKMYRNIYGKKEDFKWSTGSSMHFQALNDILISHEETENKKERENKIVKTILSNFDGISNVNLIFEKNNL